MRHRLRPNHRPSAARRLLGGVVAVALAGTGLVLATRADAAALPYQDPALPVSQRVGDLLSRMSLDDKIGQMTQGERGSVSAADVTAYRLGSILSGGGSAPASNTAAGWADMYDNYQRGALATPLQIPMIYGSDAVHGHNNVAGATIFPHNIGLGATRDPALLQQIGRATAEEVTGTGVDWTFAPCLCVARNDRWGRTYESFGEKPELASTLSTIVTGLQGTALNGPASVLATAKHYVGDGGTTGGVDQGDAQLSEADLRAIHLPPFKAAIDRGVGSVMISYSSFNGQKLHGHRYLITDVLKRELGFTGFVVSDWNAIDQLDGAPGFTGAEVAQAVNAGIDMVMVPTAWKSFIGTLRTEVQAGRVPLTRIDDANRRILTKKFELGMFERPLAERSYASTLGNAAHRALARQAVRQSQVLLKNAGNVLPLARDNNRIFVAGRHADNIGLQSGGWTMSWQGGSGNTTAGTTILQGIRAAVGPSSTVTYHAGGAGIDNTYRAAIAVVGEQPYAEGDGDRPGAMGLDSTDLNTINTLRAAGVPVIVVLVSGRPLDIAGQLANWNALLAAWLPGTEGAGVADVLFGTYAPTGKLPVTWMQSASQQPINDGDGKAALFGYGFGLGYGSAPPPDTTAPTVPGRPTASAVSSTGLTLSWPASTDAGGSALAGYDVYRENGATDALVGSPSAPTATVGGLSPQTAYQFYVVARDGAGNRSAPSPAVAVTTASGSSPSPSPSPSVSPGPGGSCQVGYTVNDWGSGFTGTVTVKNTGSTAWTGWTLRWSFPGDQRITESWGATVTQGSGPDVTAVGLSWNGPQPPGGSTSFGFNAGYRTGNPRPTAFTINGTACTVG